MRNNEQYRRTTTNKDKECNKHRQQIATTITNNESDIINDK